MLHPWYPRNTSTLRQYDIKHGDSPKARVLCFHGAGSDASQFTSRGTRLRPLTNPLLDFCIKHDIELLPVHLPGRTSRLREPRLTSVGSVVKEAFRVIAPRLFPEDNSVKNGNGTDAENEAPHPLPKLKNKDFADGIVRQSVEPAPSKTADPSLESTTSSSVSQETQGYTLPCSSPRPFRIGNDKLSQVPLVIIGHSMGAFCAFEFIRLLRSRGLPLPRFFLASCMVAPDTPPALRPWRPAAALPREELQEECRVWGAQNELFQNDLWRLYEPILRDDFQILDSYRFDAPSFHTLQKPNLDGATHRQKGQESFNDQQKILPVPTIVFYATEDQRITRKHAEEWARVSGGPASTGGEKQFTVVALTGQHNFFHQPTPRQQWMNTVIKVLEKLLDNQGFAEDF